MTFRLIIGPYRNSNFPKLADSAVLAGFFAWPRSTINRKEIVSDNSVANPGGASPQTGSAAILDDCEKEAIGLLMAEWLTANPGKSEDDAYDAVCFQILDRSEQIFRERMVRIGEMP